MIQPWNLPCACLGSTSTPSAIHCPNPAPMARVSDERRRTPGLTNAVQVGRGGGAGSAAGAALGPSPSGGPTAGGDVVAQAASRAAPTIILSRPLDTSSPPFEQ